MFNFTQELTEKPIIVVSGHHGKLHIDGLRLIIDEGGGFENKPVAAIALPSMKLFRDTDNLTKQLGVYYRLMQQVSTIFPDLAQHTHPGM